LNDIADQEPGGYEKLLTSLYDDFARLYPQYFHSLREAAKLSYGAQWLKARHARLVLGAIHRAVWNGPDEVAGTVMLRMSPSHARRGVERSEMSIQGGVSLDAPAPSRTMPGDPSVASAMGRSGCKPGTGGGNAASIGRSGGSAVLLIDCDDFSRPITFIRDKSLGKGPAKFAGPPANASKAPPSAPQP